jgi:LuxR family maltose regulon positive regulatory protein
MQLSSNKAAEGDNTTLPPLLLTKTHPPSTRPNAIPRPRLTARLNAGLAGKLTLLSAPPGFGKTTLLAEWRAALPEGWAMAWVALGPEENDAVRFWSYVVAALQTVRPGLGAETLAWLHSPQPPAFETLLAQFLNTLAALPERVILVLDDYHVIHTPAIHQALNQCLDYLPPTLHLALAGRHDPPLALANLRARGQLTELRATDLRCTDAEVARLLNTGLGLGLDAATLTALAARTEGWFAGLHLAALSLRDRADPAAFVTAFTGSHRYLIDYLGEEVLERQPPAVQTFLLRTSILEQLCAPLCDALLADEAARGAPSSAALLETLEKANLFITALDDRDAVGANYRWYRYHPLFAEFLQHRLDRYAPGAAPHMHRRACAWYQARGLTREAVEHALAAEDFDAAAALVAGEAESLLQRGDVGAVLGWLEALPEPLLTASPILELLRIWMWLLKVEVQPAAQQLATLERDLRARDAAPSLWGRWHAIAAYVVRVQQADLETSVTHAQRALELLPGEDELWRNIAQMNLAFVPLIRGDVATAARDFEAFASALTPQDDLYSKLMSLIFLGRCQIALGALWQAETTHRWVLALAEQHGALHWPSMGYIHLGLGMLERERHQLEAALRWTEQAQSRGAEVDNLELHLNATMLLVLIHLDMGDFARATTSLAQLSVHTVALGPGFQSVYDALQATVALAQEDLLTVRQWVETCGLAPTPAPDAPMPPGITFSTHELLYFILARTLLALRRPVEAQRIAEALYRAAETGARVTGMARALALETAALEMQGHTEKALATLARCLDLAEPEGHIRSLTEIDLPGASPLADVLRAYLAKHPTREYVRRLLATLPETAPLPAPPAIAPLPEPLTDRELEILRLLRTELSAPEIAERLYVAPSTVRSHIKRLYGKLDAHNRGEAIARAQSLHLL